MTDKAQDKVVFSLELDRSMRQGIQTLAFWRHIRSGRYVSAGEIVREAIKKELDKVDTYKGE